MGRSDRGAYASARSRRSAARPGGAPRPPPRSRGSRGSRREAGDRPETSAATCSSAPQEERAGRDARGAGHETDLGTVHLTRGFAAQLAHPFDDMVEAVHVGLGEAAPVRVRGKPPVGPGERAALDERAALATGAEAEVLEGEEHEPGEVIV